MNTMPALPAHLMKLAGRAVSQAAQVGTAQPPRISIRQNRFWLIDAAGNERSPVNPLQLDCVIVDANPAQSRYYYANAYDPAVKAAPTCYSDNGVAPSAQAQEPQSSACATCTHGQWGSATSKVSGKLIKECNDYKKLAVIIPGDPVVYLLAIPPNSIRKQWGPYAQTVAGNGVELQMLVTRITFDTQTQGTLNFAPVEYVNEATTDFILGLDEDKLALLVGKKDEPYAQLSAPQQTKSFLPAPQPVQTTIMPQSVMTPAQSQTVIVNEAPKARKPRATKAEMEARRAQTVAQPFIAPENAAQSVVSDTALDEAILNALSLPVD